MFWSSPSYVICISGGGTLVALRIILPSPDDCYSINSKNRQMRQPMTEFISILWSYEWIYMYMSVKLSVRLMHVEKKYSPRSKCQTKQRWCDLYVSNVFRIFVNMYIDYIHVYTNILLLLLYWQTWKFQFLSYCFCFGVVKYTGSILSTTYLVVFLLDQCYFIMIFFDARLSCLLIS